MRTSRLFCNQPLASDCEITLDEKASHYIGRVLRQKVNEPLILFNGQGGCFECTITAIEKKSVKVHIGPFSAADNMPKKALNIAIGVCKGDKMDWLIQKATELGVSSIQPLETEFCDVKLSAERWQKKCHHWQQIAISACCQSNRNRIPNLLQKMTFQQWLNQHTTTARYLFDPKGSHSLAEESPTADAITLCFGPEGGFSTQELNQAVAQNVDLLHLGPRILRAETAPIVALSICQLFET